MNTQDKIAALAADMGASVADVTAFVECLRVHTCHNPDIEAAIQKHMAVMSALLDGAVDLAHGEKHAETRRALAGGVWDEINTGAAQ